MQSANSMNIPQPSPVSTLPLERLVRYTNACLCQVNLEMKYLAVLHKEDDNWWMLVLDVPPDCKAKHKTDAIMQVYQDDRPVSSIVPQTKVPHWVIEEEHHIAQTYHEPEDWDWKEVAVTRSEVDAAKRVCFHLLNAELNHAMGVREE